MDIWILISSISRLKSVECFTPGTNRGVFTRVPDMINRRSNFSVSVMDNKIYVSGRRPVHKFHYLSSTNIDFNMD